MINKLAMFTLVFVVGATSLSWAEGNMEKATFAAGCFWGVEKVFTNLPGVLSTQVGYTGGKKKSPGYEEVCSGLTGHAEAIEITYDPAKISYEDLLETFFTHHDSTQVNRQGNDIGSQYRSAIFVYSPEQEKSARSAIEAIDRAKVLKGRVATSIEKAGEFWPAEEYHQKYLQKNPGGYCHLLLQPKKIAEALRRSAPARPAGGGRQAHREAN